MLLVRLNVPYLKIFCIRRYKIKIVMSFQDNSSMNDSDMTDMRDAASCRAPEETPLFRKRSGS